MAEAEVCILCALDADDVCDLLVNLRSLLLMIQATGRPVSLKNHFANGFGC